MKNKLATISFISFLALSPYAWADSINSVTMAGITPDNTSSLALNKETINVNVNTILVDYEFENTSKKTLHKTMQVKLPQYSANIEVANQYFGEPQNLYIGVNGKEVEYQSTVKAFHNKKDVTLSLKKAGLDNEQIAYFPSYSPFDKKVNPLTEKQIETLKKQKLLTDDTPDGDWAPAWTVEVTYHWKQSFKPGEKVQMQHSYTPFRGAGDELDQKPEANKYCSDEAFSINWDKLALKQNGYKYLPAIEIQFDTNSMKAKDYTLNIEATEETLVAACLPEKTTDLKNNILQIRAQNKTDKKTTVYFGNVDEFELQDNKAPKLK